MILLLLIFSILIIIYYFTIRNIMFLAWRHLERGPQLHAPVDLALGEAVGWSVWPVYDLQEGLISHGGEIVNSPLGTLPVEKGSKQIEADATT